MDNILIFNQNGIKAKVGSSKAGTYSPSISYTVDDIINGGVAWRNIDLITFLKSGKPTVELVETLGSVLYVGTYKINEIIGLLKGGVDGQFLGANLGNPEWQNFPVADETTQGIIEIATQTEYLNKDNGKAITANNVYNDVRLANFSVSNSATGLTQVVAIGGSYNLLTPLLEANEEQVGNIPIVYKNAANVVQNKILDEANDKFLFPSNLNTFNLSYVPYLIRVIFTVNIPTIPNDRSTEFTIAIRRVIDNSEVASIDPFVKTTGAAVTNKQYTAILKTFVNSETDPYILDGCRLFIENSAGSETTVTLTSASIRIFRD